MKKIFTTGIIFLLPTLITIFLILLAFRFLSNNIAQPLGGLVLVVLHLTTGLNLNEHSTVLKPLIGFPLALGIIFIVGYITATFVGRRIFRALEKTVLQKIPIVGLIYPYAKQLIDLLAGRKRTSFKSVVSLQYPRQGLYAIGFITSEGLPEVKNATGKQIVNVFIPSSPTPFTGYTIMVPEDEVIKLNMTVDEAIRFVVSGGILTPDNSGDELPAVRKEVS